MTTMTTERLDAEELLHLALEAAKGNRHEQAIHSLKRALDLAPEDARLHYLLGAEHAQIGLYERAVEEMGQAIVLDPGLATARFQLGLLHLTSGRAEQAEQVWAGLDDLGPEHALRRFKTGLLHLARDEFEQATQLLTQGIAMNRDNPTLNKDMQQILSSIAQLQANPGTPAHTQAKPASVKSPRVLSAYRNRDNN
jgi:tetratricopeptide (TPR) repeat protein